MADRFPAARAGSAAVLAAFTRNSSGPSIRAPTEYRPACSAPATAATTAASSRTRLPATVDPANRSPYPIVLCSRMRSPRRAVRRLSIITAATTRAPASSPPHMATAPPAPNCRAMSATTSATDRSATGHAALRPLKPRTCQHDWMISVVARTAA